MNSIFLKLVKFHLLLCSSVYALEYTANEIAVINWGVAENELAIIEPHLEGAGTDQEFKEPGLGTSIGVVDENENCVFSSYDLGYLKGFDNQGHLIFNLLSDETPIKQRMAGRTVDNFVIDSSLIYIIGFGSLPIIPIVNYQGVIVDSLMPYDWSPDIQIANLVLNYNRSLSIMRIIKGRPQTDIWVVTYDGEKFIQGGSLGFLATNGSYYSARASSPHSLTFCKYNNPDTADETKDVTYKVVEFPNDTLDMADDISGGDGSKLYVYISKEAGANLRFEVWEFDLAYNLLAKAVFPLAVNKYDWFIPPFVARNGSIYEFRCLDDGLHVVKWTKQ